MYENLTTVTLMFQLIRASITYPYKHKPVDLSYIFQMCPSEVAILMAINGVLINVCNYHKIDAHANVWPLILSGFFCVCFKVCQNNMPCDMYLTVRHSCEDNSGQVGSGVRG